jgi:hypothetical protein
VDENIISSPTKSINDYPAFEKMLFVPCADPTSILEEGGTRMRTGKMPSQTLPQRDMETNER